MFMRWFWRHWWPWWAVNEDMDSRKMYPSIYKFIPLSQLLHLGVQGLLPFCDREGMGGSRDFVGLLSRGE